MFRLGRPLARKPLLREIDHQRRTDLNLILVLDDNGLPFGVDDANVDLLDIIGVADDERVRSGSSTYSTSNPLRQRITVTVTGGGTPTPATPKETWTQTFEMPMCADYYAGSGVDGAETHQFTKLTKPSGNWKLTSEGSPAEYIGISVNKAAAQPTLIIWPSAPGYVSGTIVDPGNASNFADFGITLTYRKEETVPLLTSGRTSVQKACTYSGVYKEVSNGSWTVTSTDASVATVEGVSGSGKTISPVITALKAGTTTVTVKNTYATYVYNVVVSDPVARPVDIVFTNEVRIAQRSTQTLTNDMGTAIAWNGAVCRSSDENVVKVIQADGYVAVSNTLYDGSAQNESVDATSRRVRTEAVHHSSENHASELRMS